MTEKKTFRLQELRRQLIIPVILQLLMLLLASLILDGGVILRLCTIAVIGHWITVLYLALRRRNKLTEVDTMLIRWGFLFFLVVAMLAGTVAGLMTRLLLP